MTLRAHLAERLVDYQRPPTSVFVDELPRNAMGKVLRCAGRLPSTDRPRLVPMFAGEFVKPGAESARSRPTEERRTLDLAWISLAALVVTIVLSCTTSVNPGFLAIVFAWVIGVYLGPTTPIGLKAVVAGFPTELFLTLVGVTLLFAQAQGNGTLDRVARAAVRGCRGNVGPDPPGVLRPGAGARLDRRGEHRGRGAGRPAGDGGRRAGGDLGLPDDLMVAHGAVAGALAVRADRDHRRRADGPAGPVGPRVADLPGQPPPTPPSPRSATSSSAAGGSSAGAITRTRPIRHRRPREAFRPRHAVTLALIAP